MSPSCIESPSSIIIVMPGDGMLSHVQPTLITVFVQGHQDIDFFIEILVAIPFIRSFPRGGQKLCAGMVLVHDVYRSFLNIGMGILDARMVAEIPSDHFA